MQDNKDNSFEELNKQTTDMSSEISASLESSTSDAVDEEKELLYNKAVKFMESLRCMTACKDKVKMYQKAAKQFEELIGYQDAELLMKKCKRRAKKIKIEIKQNIYDRAVQLKNKAKTPAEYEMVAKEFRRVKGFLDADELAVQCDEQCIRIERKKLRKAIVSGVAAVLLAIVVIIGVATPFVKYWIADLSMNTGSYQIASYFFEKLDHYKDSETKLMESRYQYSLQLKDKGDYTGALNLIMNLNDYKDSAFEKAELEKKIIKSKEIGQVVSVGNLKWIILDKMENQVLLLKKEPLTDNALHDVLEEVTWETTSLRNYLNSQYLDGTFSEQEKNNIVLTEVTNRDNSIYGTEGGMDTKDYLYILSVEEMEKYRSLLPEVQINSWLRTPGYHQDSAAFLSADGTIMDYGYAVTSNHMSVYPVMWYNFGENN